MYLVKLNNCTIFLHGQHSITFLCFGKNWQTKTIIKILTINCNSTVKMEENNEINSYLKSPLTLESVNHSVRFSAGLLWYSVFVVVGWIVETKETDSMWIKLGTTTVNNTL